MSTIPSPEPKEPRLAAGAPWSFALFAKGDFRRKLRGASQHFFALKMNADFRGTSVQKIGGKSKPFFAGRAGGGGRQTRIKKEKARLLRNSRQLHYNQPDGNVSPNGLSDCEVLNVFEWVKRNIKKFHSLAFREIRRAGVK